jgi:two-component sensor histidine kinase
MAHRVSSLLRSPFRLVDSGHPWPLALLALLILFGTIWANTVVWPVEHLGYSIDPRSGQVTQVAPGSTAALAGIQPGDQLQRIYGYPWTEAVFGWSQWRMVARSTTHVAVMVERAGETLNFELPRRPPETTHQIAKIVFALLGAACWMTGVLLGLGKRHEVNGSRLVALFWLVLGGVLGSYVFAVDLCFPLWALFIWLITTILPALAIVVHIWFPARAVSRRRSVVARRFLWGVWIGSNALLIGVWLTWQPRLADLLAYAWVPLVIALVITFLGSVLLLVDAYRHVRTPHVRRQIRLIAAACLISAIVWLLFRVIPLVLGVPPLLPEAVIDLVPILIPLAYLVSGTATSLYTLDRLIRRVVLELIVITLVVIAFSATAGYVAQAGREAIVWSALLFGVLIHPLVGWSRRLRSEQGNPDRSYAALRRARQLLTTSLDPAFLLLAIREGIQGAFDRPPVAIYHADSDDAEALRLVQQDGFPDLPSALPVGELTTCLQRGAPVVEARTLHLELRTTELTADEEAAVRHQGVALWGVVRHERGTLLAIILIGSDVSLEPYRAEDCRAIEDVLDAAVLALAHSSAYERLREAEATMRDLYDTMRRVEDETAAELVRTVHDDIVNNDVQLNIMALQMLLVRTPDQPMHGELERLLKREQKINRALRGICERLHPTGIDDPMGLPGVLRGLTDRMVVVWQGTCQVEITGVAVPINSTIQLEVYRIAREALINAVKHADATVITVHLHYPACPDDPLTLIVADNGCSGKPIELRPGHWGIRNMMESARVAGGELHFAQALGGGTEVVLTFHASRGGADVPRERPIIGRQVRTA